jgi:hypothetical protein
MGVMESGTLRKPSQSRSGQNPAADYDSPMTVTLPPALEAAILEGVHSPHQRYDTSVMDRIRQNARSIA